MANEVYPALDIAIVLSLNPIDTNTLRVPEHLQDTRWNSPERIDAFCKWVDWTLAQLLNATIQAIAVGNEIDGWFGSHPDKLAGYATFFNAVADHIRTHHPNIPIGVKITFAGRTGKLASDFGKLESSTV